MTPQERDDRVVVNPETWYAIWDAQKREVGREVKCPRCYGTGEDPKVEDADCLECWGDGTILLED